MAKKTPVIFKGTITRVGPNGEHRKSVFEHPLHEPVEFPFVQLKKGCRTRVRTKHDDPTSETFHTSRIKDFESFSEGSHFFVTTRNSFYIMKIHELLP